MKAVLGTKAKEEIILIPNRSKNAGEKY